MTTKPDMIAWLVDLGRNDVDRVGGKNASLGELFNQLAAAGIAVPDGFALTSAAYWRYLEDNHLTKPLQRQLNRMQTGEQSLAKTGQAIRSLILDATFPADITEAIAQAYETLCQRTGRSGLDVAVRSSATAEDLPQASFAGQQESYLNISGRDALLEACRRCYASLFTDRAIAYREENGFDHMAVALSVGVQQMVRSDKACAGVMFTLDTETGFPDAVLINGAWGLGESVVQGSVNPDRFMVFKPLLEQEGRVPIIERRCGTQEHKWIYGDTEAAATQQVETSEAERAAYVLDKSEILQLARWACRIERHYGCAMDIEWAKDGEMGTLFIVQARPETALARKEQGVLVSYKLSQTGTILAQGDSVGDSIATGQVYRISNPAERDRFPVGGILVTERTDPDWVPLMRQAAGVITDTGGTTSHAAIVSRELRIPAVVGTSNATRVLHDKQAVTLSCAEGEEGKIYEGILPFETQRIELADIPRIHTDIMINVAIPESALRWWQLPVSGIGLTRIEFIIGSLIQVHPMALVHFDRVEDAQTRHKIETLTRGYPDKATYFVERLAEGIAKIAASQYPRPVIVRLSDFKSNEYRSLLGGAAFEGKEENPMLGVRGASRYYSDRYRDAFRLECEALRQVRLERGFTNVIVMIPFCRTPGEADRVLGIMAQAGLRRGEAGLQVYVMCEIPSNVVLADRFAQRFDGFSIGSNDLTQLVLGIDRDSTELSNLFDARDEAVKRMISQVIQVAHQYGCKVGICGQAPSDHPDFAEFLVQAGIDSISLNPDSVFRTIQHIAQAERSLSD